MKRRALLESVHIAGGTVISDKTRPLYLSAVKKFVVFGAGGLCGAVINWMITYGMTEYLNVYYIISVVTGCTVNIIFNFLYHRSITFKVYSYVITRFLKFVVVSVLIIGLTTSLTFVFTEIFGLWYLYSAIVAVCIITVLNFVINSYFVFSEAKGNQ